MVSPDPGVAEPALALLAAASQAGVRGADPGSWWALRDVTTDRPVRRPDEAVHVSPSKVTYFSECALRWFLTSVGGDGVALGAASVGTFVHDIVAELPDAPLEVLDGEVDARWGRLGLPSGWVTDRTRRQAHDMVARFVAYRESVAGEWEPVGVETEFRVRIGRAVVAGRVDRIERDSRGRLRIVDLKTGTSKPTKAELERHGQLGAYQVAVEADGFPSLGSDSAGAALVYIGKGGLAGLRPSVLTQGALAAVRGAGLGPFARGGDRRSHERRQLSLRRKAVAAPARSSPPVPSSRKEMPCDRDNRAGDGGSRGGALLRRRRRPCAGPAGSDG